MESMSGRLKGAPSDDSVVLLGGFNTDVGNDSEIWQGLIGRNSLPDLICKISLSIKNTMFKHTPINASAPGRMMKKYISKE